jgi:hypothetical protein
MSADKINPVSVTHAQDLLSDHTGFGGMGAIIDWCRHYDFSGIVNGLDTDIWDPKTDKHVAKNYDLSTVKEGKRANKRAIFKQLGMDEDFMDFVKKNPQEDTCISALSEDYAGIGSLTSAGHIILNQDKEALKRNYLKLNEMTKKACAPKNKVRGVVNFASPLPLFYSDMSDESYALNYYNRLMIKYIFENGIFMITANFREDPLGFPTNQNLTIKEIEKILNISINNPTGVVYDNSGIWSKRIFPFAHTSYWTARGAFTNAVVKSFVNGYKFQYDEKYQKKILKRSNKKSEL